VSRRDAKFPQPSAERGRNYFTGEQVFRYIVEHRRKARKVVPRLFPRVAEPAPAQFISAQRVSLPEVGSFAIHIWQPADGDQPIAIAYPDRENTMNIHNVARCTADLLKCLPPKIDAVAVPNGETSPRKVDGDKYEYEPTIVVAERNPGYRRDPISHGAARYAWSDLANLLRVDIPWWSHLLRHHIWPLPDAGFDYYRTRYEGGGPQRLAETLTTLLRDAAADVHRPPIVDDDNRADFDALYRLVTQRQAPITVAADSDATRVVDE
jgi:hypothetical protein